MQGRAPSNKVLAVLAVVVVLAGAFAVGAAWIRGHRSTPSTLRASGIPADVPTPIANLMGLSPIPDRAAPNFTLTDQRAVTAALSGLKGHAVVLEFMDPHCTDICPIVSQEFVDAYHDLGTSASKVAFVAVNVNKYVRGVASMATYSREHGLATIPSWHFYTGALPALQSVWHDYGIEVQAPSPTADVIHTSIIYFIDADGHERFIADPEADHTRAGTAYLPANQITAWGKGVALVADQLSH